METVETGDKNRDDLLCMQMSLVMSVRFIFGDGWNDTCKLNTFLAMMLLLRVKNDHYCGALRRYVSQNIVAVTGILRLNRFTFLYVFNWYIFVLLRSDVAIHLINTWNINDITFDYFWKQFQPPVWRYECVTDVFIRVAALRVHRKEIPFRAFPERASPRILSLESIDYFTTSDYFSGRKKEQS